MSSIAMRRELCREATGPTEDEFASEGATFLVGVIFPRYDDRLSDHYMLTPRDSQYTRFKYLDALPVLTGDLSGLITDIAGYADEAGVGALFGGGKKMITTAEQQRRLAAAQMRQAKQAARAETRQVNRTGAAARALIRWAEDEGVEVDIPAEWGAGEKGNGFVFTAKDEHTLLHLQAKGRSIAKDPRFKSYFTIVAGPDGQYLAAFVTQPQYTVLDYPTAIAIAEATIEPGTPGSFFESEVAPMIRFGADASEIIAEPIGEDGSSGIFKKLFGPKKPEGIKKRIEKLKAELSELEDKLKEAEAKSAGFGSGFDYNSSPSGFDYDMGSRGLVIGNVTQLQRRFRRAEQGSYATDDVDDWDAGQEGRYAVESPDLFEDEDEFADFSPEVPEQFDVYDDDDDDDDDNAEAGAFIPMPMSVSMPSSSTGSKRGGKRRKRRRKMRRKSRQRSRSRRQGGGGGGGQQQAQPQIIVIQQPAQSDEYEDDEYESDGVGGWSGWGGRVRDVPNSPNGWNVNYPVGGVDDEDDDF